MFGSMFGQSKLYMGHVCEVTPLTVSLWLVIGQKQMGFFKSAEIILVRLCHLYFCLIMVAETLSRVLKFCVVNVSLFFVATL